MKTVAIISGGLDSVTLAHYLKKQGMDLHLLAFNYGQRHKKELAFAQQAAHDLEARFDLVDLSGIGGMLKGSSLTDDIPVPDGHYADENMKITVVPNRNAIMLSIAYGVAVAENAEAVAIGVHSGDHFIYPDCRPGFIQAFEQMEYKANEGLARVDLLAPFLTLDKSGIVSIGALIGVPFIQTWSCYKGEELHCGTCGTCVERREAFQLAGILDPTIYKGKAVVSPRPTV